MNPTENDFNRFYDLLGRLEAATGFRKLSNCGGKDQWPARGVYFFFEPGQTRPCGSPRVVRIGTHAVCIGAKTTLWKRLSQHKGTIKTGGGNHRGSIFRRHVGSALLNANRITPPLGSAWGEGSNAPKVTRVAEFPIERLVSEHIRNMPLLWIDADDEPGKHSIRSVIERNSIALLSQSAGASHHEAPSNDWLGLQSTNAAIASSGLWNVNYIAGEYDPAFLGLLEKAVERTVSA